MAFSFPSLSKVTGAVGTILGGSGSFTKYIVFALILISGTLAFYFYYNDTQERLRENADRIGKQEVAISLQNATIEEMKKDKLERERITKQLYEDFERARTRNDKDPFAPDDVIIEPSEPEEIGPIVVIPDDIVLVPNITPPVKAIIPAPAKSNLDSDMKKEFGVTEDQLNQRFNDVQKCFELYSLSEAKLKNANKKLLDDCGITDSTISP